MWPRPEESVGARASIPPKHVVKCCERSVRLPAISLVAPSCALPISLSSLSLLSLSLSRRSLVLSLSLSICNPHPPLSRLLPPISARLSLHRLSLLPSLSIRLPPAALANMPHQHALLQGMIYVNHDIPDHTICVRRSAVKVSSPAEPGEWDNIVEGIDVVNSTDRERRP